MPLYEYQCETCGRFEIIRKFSDSALRVCPTCGQEVQKLPSAPAIQFKGSGWYITDYARKSAGSDGAAKAADGSASSDSTASPSKDSAPSPSKDSAPSPSKDSTPTTTTSKDSSASGSSPAK